MSNLGVAESRLSQSQAILRVPPVPRPAPQPADRGTVYNSLVTEPLEQAEPVSDIQHLDSQDAAGQSSQSPVGIGAQLTITYCIY